MAVAKLIHSNKSLEEVNMMNCSIDSEGACHLVQGLCENPVVCALRGLHVISARGWDKDEGKCISCSRPLPHCPSALTKPVVHTKLVSK